MLELVPYLSLILIVLFISNISFGKNKKNSILLPVIMITIFSAIRYKVGTDYMNYINIYNSFTLGELSNINIIKDEIGFKLVLYISKYIFKSPDFLFIITSIIQGIFLYLIIKKDGNEKGNWIPLLMYITFLMPFEMNGIRQGIACLITFYALQQYLDGHKIKCIIYTLLACTFHITAIIILPTIVLIEFTKNDRKKMIIGFVIALLVLLISGATIFNSIIDKLDLNRYDSYIAEGDYNIVAIIKTLLVRTPIYLFLYLNRKDILKEKKYNVLLTLVLLEIVCILSKGISFFTFRLMYYYTMATPLLIKNVYNNGNNKTIKSIYLVGYNLIFFVWSYYILGQANIIPYNTIFDKF